jgi:hypothetical protein
MSLPMGIDLRTPVRAHLYCTPQEADGAIQCDRGEGVNVAREQGWIRHRNWNNAYSSLFSAMRISQWLSDPSNGS